jgi:hypothetical protein
MILLCFLTSQPFAYLLPNKTPDLNFHVRKSSLAYNSKRIITIKAFFSSKHSYLNQPKFVNFFSQIHSFKINTPYTMTIEKQIKLKPLLIA